MPATETAKHSNPSKNTFNRLIAAALTITNGLWVWSGHAQNLHWENETFDAAFAVEATCHSPDKVSQDITRRSRL